MTEAGTSDHEGVGIFMLMVILPVLVFGSLWHLFVNIPPEHIGFLRTFLEFSFCSMTMYAMAWWIWLWKIKATSFDGGCSHVRRAWSNVRNPITAWPDSPPRELPAIPAFLGEAGYFQGFAATPGVEPVGEGTLESNVRVQTDQIFLLMDEALVLSSIMLWVFSLLQYDVTEETSRCTKGQSACNYGGRSRIRLWYQKWKEGDMQDWGDR